MTDKHYFEERRLFSTKDLHALITAYEVNVRNEVERWERNKILSASEPDLIEYLVQTYTLHVPVLDSVNRYIESEGEARIDVSNRWEYAIFDRSSPSYIPGAYVTVAIPFEGDGDLFEFRASTFSTAPARAHVADSKILISFRGTELDPEQVSKEIARVTSSIEQGLSWVREDCKKWNARVRSHAEECVRSRKRRLLEQAKMVSALGLPLKRRPDAETNTAMPMKRRRRPVALPPTPTEAFKPEPVLADAEYGHILEVIDRLALQIERSPSTFSKLDEEQIRDMILVNLNGHYEGGATGETFNGVGKTDILIREKDRNVFIAECKFWAGPKSIRDAIDQILGYLTWRDTKAALVVFSRNRDFTNVLSSAVSSISSHPNFKRGLRQVSETHSRHLFRQKSDSNRDLYLALQVFNIPNDGTNMRKGRASA